MVNELGKGLRSHNSESTMPFRKGIADEEWDEYDEFWGFDDVPTGFENYAEHVQAHLDRCVRGIPTPIEPQNVAFYERVRRRTGSRMARGRSP
eukprot:3566485-Heterocapsa_arctica.AAC.1